MQQNYEITPFLKKKNAVCFAVDNKYAKFLSVVLLSFYKNSDKNKNYDIVILNNNISDINKDKLLKEAPQNISLRFYDINPIKNDFVCGGKFKPKRYWSESIYYRLLIPVIFNLYDKVLYCDSDILFNKNIDEIFEITTNSKGLLAVVDSCVQELEFDKKRKAFIKNYLNLKNPKKYFNSGILQFNIKNINIEKYTKKLISILNHYDNLMFPDQDILNIIFEDDVKHISQVFNFQICIPLYLQEHFNSYEKDFLDDYFKAFNNPKIIHYSGTIKPWHKPNLIFYEKFWQVARESKFYEEIIFDNFDETLKLMIGKDEIFKKYRFAKILSKITFGKTRKKYKKQRDYLKGKVQSIRKIINGVTSQ